MSVQPMNWETAIDEILDDLMVIPRATPAWLVHPETDRPIIVDRLYSEIGLALFFHPYTGDTSRPGVDGQKIAQLCAAQGATYFAVDPSRRLTPEVLEELATALNRIAKRLIHARGAETAKKELLPRIIAARNRCRTIRDLMAASAGIESPPPVRFSRHERRQQQLNANWMRFKRAWALFVEDKFALVGVVLLVVFGLAAIAHPILRSSIWAAEMYNPKTGFDFSCAPHPSPPSWIPQLNNPNHQINFSHLLGTDTLGHDVMSLLLAATTPAFVIGITAALATALVSVTMGSVAAYFGGFVDAVVKQIADIFLLVPAPLFMVMFGVALKDYGAMEYGLIYGVVAGLGGATIVMRAYGKSLVTRPFIEASRISGGRGGHIILRHMLPHMLPLAALYMMISVVGAVVSDGFISFFGFNRPFINWGSIIYSSFTFQSYIPAISWNVFLPASLALSLFAASFYLMARGLHQVADPRLRSG